MARSSSHFSVLSLTLCLIVSLLEIGCGGKRPTVHGGGRLRVGQYYVIKPGDTIWKVARTWRVPVQDIAEWNNIQDPDKIAPGRKIFLPRVGRTPTKSRPPTKIAAAYDAPIRLYNGQFLWPVRGPIHGSFGVRGDRRHDGIDIGAPNGTPIRAAATGEVAYSKTLSGYGYLLILRHPDQFYTAYAHNSRNVAKVGQKVKQGEVIAYVGSTGHATGPHLHFEVRHGQKARNPLFFLPVNSAEVAGLKAKGKGELPTPPKNNQKVAKKKG